MPTIARSRVAALVGVALVLTAAGCSSGSNDSDGGAEASSTTVVVQDMAFTPSSLTVTAGQTVTWQFDDRGVPHNVVGLDAAKALMNSPIQPTGSYSVTFADPGTYEYECTLHPEMRGSVTVVPA